MPELEKGLSAVDAVVLAAELLENDPLYNAGLGSKIQSDGKIRMSSSLMDGSKGRFAGCVNVEGVKNPIYLAKGLIKKKDRVLSGAGAQKFAREIGLKFGSNYTEERRREFRRKKSGKSGTIGAVALDSLGRIAAATSTGGRGFEYPYRVSDSPTVAGNFANKFGGVSATGTGEEIVEAAVASRLCTFLEAGISLERAVDLIFKGARQAKAEYAMIALNAKGEYFAATSTKGLVWAVADRRGYRAMETERRY